MTGDTTEKDVEHLQKTRSRKGTGFCFVFTDRKEGGHSKNACVVGAVLLA